MATAAALEAAYRARVRTLLDAMAARLDREYGRRVNLADIDRTFALFVPEAVSIISAAQAAGVNLSLAFLRASLAERAQRAIEPSPPTASPIGLNEQGRPLAAGLAAVPSMLKEAIGKGRALEDVRTLGRSLVTRFGDAETTRAMDTALVQSAMNTTEVVGWEGLVRSNACDPCRGNAGQHDVAQTMYRHPGCDCVRQWVVA